MGIDEKQLNKLFEKLSNHGDEVVWEILLEMSKWHIGEVIEILKHVREHDKN